MTTRCCIVDNVKSVQVNITLQYVVYAHKLYYEVVSLITLRIDGSAQFFLPTRVYLYFK